MKSAHLITVIAFLLAGQATFGSNVPGVSVGHPLRTDTSPAAYCEQNQYFNTGSGGQCTAFCWGRAKEKLDINLPHWSDAQTWYSKAAQASYKLGSEAQANSIAVWSYGKYGHVAFVEEVNGDQVTFNEANTGPNSNYNWGCGYVGAKTWSKAKMAGRDLGNLGDTHLQGYIYLTAAQPTPAANNTYVFCANGTIMKVDSGGNKSIFASGLSTASFGLACDQRGNLYATISGYPSWIGSFVKFNSSGNMSILASDLSGPAGLAFDSSGNLYEANWGGTIMKLDTSGNMSIFASGLSGGPHGLAFDKNGYLYATGANSGMIMKFDLSGHISTFASGLSMPTALVFDNSGNLFVGDNVTGMIFKFDSSGNRSTFASGLNGGLWGLVFDSGSNLLASEGDTGTIFKFDSSGNRSTFASGLSYPMAITTWIPKHARITARVFCPVELMVYDSQGRGTGLKSGQVITEIPDSVYDNNSVTLLFPSDSNSYRYEVTGTGEGIYTLQISDLSEEGQESIVDACDIPIIAGAVNLYEVNWTTLSQGQEGVTISIDQDGDGAFERTITSDSNLSGVEFNKKPIAAAGMDQTVYASIDKNAQISLDGSGSSDADGDVLTYKWTWVIGVNTSEANGVNPVIELPVGVHTITLVANDGTIDSAPDEVVITVLGPFELLGQLKEDVAALHSDKDIANSLLAKLDTVIKKLEDKKAKNNVAAFNELHAFINAVNAQRSKKITQEDANHLIEVAQRVIGLLS